MQMGTYVSTKAISELGGRPSTFSPSSSCISWDGKTKREVLLSGVIVDGAVHQKRGNENAHDGSDVFFNGKAKTLKPENVRDGVICRFGTNLITISCRIKMQ